jgi:hypothetical protein
MHTTKSLTSAAITEAVAVVVTCLFGVVGAWGLFAASALICVLSPLWVIAVATAAIAAKFYPETPDKE